MENCEEMIRPVLLIWQAVIKETETKRAMSIQRQCYKPAVVTRTTLTFYSFSRIFWVAHFSLSRRLHSLLYIFIITILSAPSFYFMVLVFFNNCLLDLTRMPSTPLMHASDLLHRRGVGVILSDSPIKISLV